MSVYREAENRTLIYDVLESAVQELNTATFGASTAKSLALQTIMALRINFAIHEGENDPSKLQRLALNAIENLY